MNNAPVRVSLSSPETAKSFVRDLDLSGLPVHPAPVRSVLSAPFHALLVKPAPAPAAAVVAPASSEGLNIKSGVEQAWLVGSQIVSFDQDVTADRRKAALHSALLAQLAATKKFPFHEDPDTAKAWHATYVSTLTSVGWVLQGGEVAQNSSGQTNVAVDKVILDIVGSLLPGGTALVMVKRVIDALMKLNDNDPLITLYASRTIAQNSVDFAMSLASGAGTGFLVNALEYALDVEVTHNQALFFKWDSTNASLSSRRFDLSLDDEIYSTVEAAIADKLKSFVQGSISAIDL